MALALVWSIAFIYLMSWFAETMAWCCILLIQVGLAAASAQLLMMTDKEFKKLGQIKQE
jgi:hypothetical protein